MIHPDISQVKIGKRCDKRILKSLDLTAGSVISPTYCLHPLDIRKLPENADLPPFLDPNLPTVILSECCLIYMNQTEATVLLQWFSKTFGSAGVAIILYEPIGGHDAFGRMMVRNLAVDPREKLS
jgi:[phosphatase 2A protein]-leucine-carboxy methyltransferase